VTAGDFDSNGRDDIAIGTPHEDFPESINNAGAVYISEY
jgi:hypothetical protein